MRDRYREVYETIHWSVSERVNPGVGRCRRRSGGRRIALRGYPGEIAFIDSLPTTNTGKIRRRVLGLREDARNRGRTHRDGESR